MTVTTWSSYLTHLLWGGLAGAGLDGGGRDDACGATADSGSRAGHLLLRVRSSV